MLGDGATFSIMVGAGETYLPAFALAAGCGDIAAGLVTTLPLLMGATAQLVAPWGVRHFGSNRRWVMTCAFCQGLSFLPLLVAALLHRVPSVLLFLAAACYWGAGLATGPAWSTWAGTLVPRRVRTSYFAWRTRLSQAGILLGFVGGGIALQIGSGRGLTLETFAMLFLVATVCRCISVSFLASQSEPYPPSNHRRLSVRELLRRFRRGADGSLLLYFLAVQCAVQISGPYFNPYMLKHLRFSYTQYMLLIAAAYLSRFLALPSLGRLARRTSARRLLWLGGAGIVPLSAAWLISNNFFYLVGLQLVVGVFWAAYELATFLLFFEAIREEERTSLLTMFNFAHAVSTVTGSLLGGAILALYGESPSAYLTLFAVSSVARFAALALLWRVPKVGDREVTVVSDEISAEAEMDRVRAVSVS
jgi:MFS family permease